MKVSIAQLIPAFIIALAVSVPTYTFAANTAQLVVVTRTDTVSSIPPNNPLVTISGTAPSLTSTLSSSGTLVYATPFVNETRVVTLLPGTYTATAQSANGYAFLYSTDCSGYMTSGEVRTCTITAQGGGTSRVNVSVTVLNANGGVKTASDFITTVSATNPSMTSFAGSQGSVQVTMSPGAYSIDVSSTSGYARSRTDGCTGVIGAGETRACAITLTDASTYYTGGAVFNNLSCSPANQTVNQGTTVTFTAAGASGPYNWSTGTRTSLNVGPTLNVLLVTPGTQTVYVSNGYQTAFCQVTVRPVSGYTYSSTSQVTPASGVVLGASTVAPGVPNTGFAPSSTFVSFLAALLLILLAPLALALFPYARATISSSRR